MDFSKIRGYLFLGLLFVVTLSFLGLLKIFAYPIFWAAIIAALIHPIYTHLNRFFKHKNLTTVISLILVLLIIIIPLFSVGTLLVKQSIDFYVSFNDESNQIGPTVQKAIEWIKNNPLTARLQIDEAFWIEKMGEISQTITAFVFTALKNLTQDSLKFVVMFVIMFYTLFFFLRDGDRLLAKLMYLCPLGDKYERMLYGKFTSTARATIKGTLIIGGLQGLLGGIMFMIAGIPGALIWGILMIVCSIIPGLGSFIVWLPTGIIMLLLGNTWQGIMILLGGALIISTVDNLLRPFLVGRDTELHPLLILFSTLGGIAAFGVSGFIIGPIIASLLVAFWHMYEEYYKNELSRN